MNANHELLGRSITEILNELPEIPDEIPTLSKTGFFIENSQKATVEARNLLYGETQIHHAVCPSCAHALVRYARIDLSDQSLGVSRSDLGTIELFFCLRCSLNHFYYRMVGQSLQVHEFAVLTDDVLPPCNTTAASAATFTPLSHAQQQFVIEQNRILRLIEMAHDRDDYAHALYLQRVSEKHWATYMDVMPSSHQFGAFPLLVQPWSYWAHVCPTCKQDMPFIAQFENGPDYNDMVTMFTICPSCRIIGASAY